MFEDPLMEVRTSLNTTTNTTGSLDSYGVEIQHMIDTVISDVINRGVDLKPLIKRKPTGQLTYHWNMRTSLNDGTSKFAVYSDGGSGTPRPSTKKLFDATCIPYRSDYEVTGIMMAGSSSYYDALGDESRCALDEMKLGEEKMMICGADTAAYGITSGFDGLLQFMRWHTTNGGDTEGTSANKMLDTDTMFGETRAAGTTHLDVSYVIAGTVSSATGVLELKHMDKAITLSNNHGGKGRERIFFVSEFRGDEIDQLLQPQQRFAGTLNLEGGFSISTYKNYPIIRSRYMDQNGATNVSTWDSSTNEDNAMYFLDLDSLEMRILDGVDTQHVLVAGEVSGTPGYNRADVQGGYFKTYGIFVCHNFNTQVNICNLTAPA